MGEIKGFIGRQGRRGFIWVGTLKLQLHNYSLVFPQYGPEHPGDCF